MSGYWYIFFIALPIMIIACVMYAIEENKCDYGFLWGVSLVSFIISGVLTGVSLLIGLINPVVAKKEISEFNIQKEYIQMAVINGNDLENIAITQMIIEQNTWLADAKASLETFGAFSRYYGTDLEDLEPIVIER
jgi:hypothetical protein